MQRNQLTTLFCQFNSRVIALDMDGAEIFQSVPLTGVVAGTPVTDYVGSHILVTHNQDRLNGYLSIFFLGNFSAGEPLGPVFSGIYQDVLDDGTVIQKPFSPIGYFHNPAEGYYTGGEDNRNDMFLFCWDTPRGAATVGENDGRIFAVQFPKDYAYDGNGLTFFPLGNTTDFQSPNPPVLSNAGRSYYWAVTKSSQDVVVGVEGLDRFRFDRNRRTNRVGFERAEFPFPAYAAARTPPTLSSDPNEPAVFGVGFTQIWRMNYNYSETSRIIQPTTDIVSARVLLSPQEDSLWYATQAFATTGRLHMLSADTLEEVWSVTINGGVDGDMVMSLGGTVLYLATPSGELFAFQVADILEAPITRAPADTTTPTLPANMTSLLDSTHYPTINPSPTFDEKTGAPTLTPDSSTFTPSKAAVTAEFTMTPEMNTTSPTLANETAAPSPESNVTFDVNTTSAPLVNETAAPILESNTTEGGPVEKIWAPSVAPTVLGSKRELFLNLDLLQILEYQDDLSTLMTAILLTDIYWLLNQTLTEFTLFAPTNHAFDELEQDFLPKYLSQDWKVHLENLLLFHIVAGSLFAENITNGMIIESVLQFNSGPADNITAVVDSSSSMERSIFLFGSSFEAGGIVEANLVANNGVIHKVDQVFVPYTLTLNLLERVAQVDDFSILSGLIVTAGLDELLSATDTLTLFGPSDDAFGAVDLEILESLRNDMDALQVVLLNHIVEGNNWGLARMYDNMTLTSLAGNALRITTRNQRIEVFVDGALIISTDQVASNGLFHIIDAVLIPNMTFYPNSTEAPGATSLPEGAEAPNATRAPNATTFPDTPNVTSFPEVMGAPNETVYPNATETTNATAFPEVSVTPKLSDEASRVPSYAPSFPPSDVVSSSPSYMPSDNPSYVPSPLPSDVPSHSPSSQLTSDDLDCSFQQETSLAGVNNLILRQYVNQVEKTVTIQLVYGDIGWIGIGFSRDGLMVGNRAVIGLPDDDAVGVYELGAKTLAQIVPVENELLIDASVEQTETETILTFTRSVMENNETVVEEGASSRIIFAVGTVNYLSYHVARGSADVTFDSCVVIRR